MTDGLVCGRGQCWSSRGQERKEQVHITTPEEPASSQAWRGSENFYRHLQHHLPPKIRSLNSKRKISNSRNKKIMKF